ncbi:Hypothetical predicted protein, partial [Paramuricea clavata]
MASDQSSASESTPNGGETRTPSPSIQWAAAFQSPEFTTGLQAAITQALRQSRAPIDQSASLEELGNPANTFRAPTRTVHQLETQVGGSQSRQNTGMLNAPLFVATSELNGAETHADPSVNITQTRPNGISENHELARQLCPSAFVSNSSPENAFVLGPGRAPIPTKLVKRIVTHEFIEMSELNPDNLAEPQSETAVFSIEGSSIIPKPASTKKRDISDILT